MPIALARRRARGLAVLTVAVVLFALVGCTQPEPKPIPSGPSETTEPVFASDEEALAAAEEAYALYQETWNLVAMEGGIDAERMEPYVHPDNIQETLDGLARFEDQGLHTSGDVRFTELRLQAHREPRAGVAEVTIYACVDFTKSRVIDSAGGDVTPPERDEIRPAQVRFVSGSAEPKLLVFGGDEIWDGEDFCL